MKIEYIKPQNNNKESIYILVVVIVLLITSVLLINLTKDNNEDKLLSEKEISSFESFNSEENGIYSDLYNFSTDLEFFAKDMGYSSIESLENENIYPFVKDELWKKRGKIEWSLIVKKDHYYYLGISKDENIGNFLIESFIEENEVRTIIKYYKGKVLEKDILKISQMFYEVKPLTGNDI
ncbi:hypothetical protein KX935_07195 [Streptobacillus moniliformis]|uniref:Uncharacterized protein n=1 Tax=Streptobacillus moniliformis (strain ATCC 14647 / DSM 12112 / NCTC 10651 / 9901) TaxID=519441 RepID=D1AWW3_STRM9|nr:hypothetical protein [Streptobacillus moniliformis]ACZ00789.1 hypothetical protein Smon_0305 [Streptobacillus moniliformis DSM 12112]AVL42813.1 hypothetical protein CEP89_02670 [Streptobacillus moniliformis]QXW65543.1 hypothetical protein KX935_07195 [Streptobacillus moniliformis]